MYVTRDKGFHQPWRQIVSLNLFYESNEVKQIRVDRVMTFLLWLKNSSNFQKNIKINFFRLISIKIQKFVFPLANGPSNIEGKKIHDFNFFRILKYGAGQIDPKPMKRLDFLNFIKDGAKKRM